MAFVSFEEAWERLSIHTGIKLTVPQHIQLYIKPRMAMILKSYFRR
jgi:hypothetical protein